MPRCFLLILPLLAISACAPDQPAVKEADSGSTTVDSTRSPALAWASAPREGVRLEGGATLHVETGPHTVLWTPGQGPVAPPYTVQATMRKVHGRLHEGYGVVLGGDPLDAAENEQRYTYFLVRGDGSYLLKRRSGAETPLIRGWTFHPAIGRDTEEGGETNRLTVRVGAAEVSFQVNGEEVARIPSGEIDVRGIPGLRVAHDIELLVSDFRVTAAAPAIRPPE